MAIESSTIKFPVDRRPSCPAAVDTQVLTEIRELMEITANEGGLQGANLSEIPGKGVILPFRKK